MSTSAPDSSFLADVLAMARSGAKEAKKEKKKKAKAKILSKEEERQRKLNPIFRDSPWQAVALVALFQRNTCSYCGGQTIIAAAKAPLYRFKHKKHDIIWEKEMLDFQTDSFLPRVKKFLEARVEYCLDCVDEIKKEKPIPKFNYHQSEKAIRALHDLDVLEWRKETSPVPRNKSLIPIANLVKFP